MNLTSRLNSPWGVTLTVAALFFLFICGRLFQAHFDFSSFIVAGDQFSDPSHTPEGLTVLRNSRGYDGQFYYRLALNPFTSQMTEFGITLDGAGYRQQRIFYPALASIFSLGRADFLPFMMIFINFTALGALGWIGASYAQLAGRSAVWGIFLPLHPAFLFSLSRNLVEILQITLILGSLLLLRRGKSLAATALLVFAILTKETALLVAAAALFVYLIQRWQGKDDEVIPPYYFALPMLVFVCWQGILFYHWGASPHGGTSNRLLGLPLAGPAALLLEASKFETSFHRRCFAELVFLLIFALGVLYHLRATAILRVLVISCLLFGALAVSLNREVWIEDWGFFRAVSQFCALGTVVLITSDVKAKGWILGCSGFFWLFLVERLMRHYS